MTFSSYGGDGDEPLGLRSIHRGMNLMRFVTWQVFRHTGCHMVVVVVAAAVGVANNAHVVARKAGD